VCYNYVDEGNNHFFTFEYNKTQDNAVVSFSTIDCTVSQVTVNGWDGYFIQSEKPTEISNSLTWVDEDLNIQFTISGFFTEKELFSFAKKIIKN
jgi:hypothetical protein